MICTPRVIQSPEYPHPLVLSCWEHGTIATYGQDAPAAQVATDLVTHHGLAGVDWPALADQLAAALRGLREHGLYEPDHYSRAYSAWLDEHVKLLNAADTALAAYDQERKP